MNGNTFAYIIEIFRLTYNDCNVAWGLLLLVLILHYSEYKSDWGGGVKLDLHSILEVLVWFSQLYPSFTNINLVN